MSDLKNKKVRVRFAPSPTGGLHIGGVRTALFNYLFAKKHDGEFLLRIEDTDQTRFVEGAEKYIIDSLNWLGITPDNSFNTDGTVKYKQSQREYKTYIDILISKGHAYYAFDSSEELEKLREELKVSGADNLGYNYLSREKMKNSYTLSAVVVKELIDSGKPYVIRFNTPRDKEIKFTDSVKGNIVVNSNTLDDKVLFKSDGLPTYHLANVVDDYLMEITHVIRADEWLPSAPLHIMLYEAFDWEAPEFCHLPLVLGPDGKKLSKRHAAKYNFPIFPITWDYHNEKGEAVHIIGFKDEGFEADALINFLALLGWNPGNNEEFMSVDEMISLFSLERINTSGAKFDIEKLKNFNAHYLRNRNDMLLFKQYIEPNVSEEYQNYIYNDNQKTKIVGFAKERAVFSKELYKFVSYFFEPVVLKDEISLKNPTEFTLIMKAVLVSSYKESDWTADFIQSDLEAFCETLAIKIGKVLPDLRMALTGGIPGPDLPTTMEILGKNESFRRIRNLLDKTNVKK